ncbi:MAG: MBL fold metallo-hydrolase [Flavobacteriales bacterium]|nr:MBL fold metallo-hydrolase [Flavobacteriales bacterium]
MKHCKSSLKQIIIQNDVQRRAESCLSNPRSSSNKILHSPSTPLRAGALNDGGFWLFVLLVSCTSCSNPEPIKVTYPAPDEVSIVVLGTIQDAGSPQIMCQKKCCENLYTTPDPSRQVVSLGIIDREMGMTWMLEATPDFTTQATTLSIHSGNENDQLPDGIFLTHAHMGHYTGLMYLGKEAMNASRVPVYAMPKMRSFLENNGPWSQLVADSNIVIQELKDEVRVELSENVKVTPFTVPHRDEFSETVGYKIEGPSKSALFIPDIDKWSKWSKSIADEIRAVDFAFLDATFYDGEELGNRNMSDIPHPFVVETMKHLKELSPEDKSKIYFIHFNHTNPIIDNQSPEYTKVKKSGFKIAKPGQMVQL